MSHSFSDSRRWMQEGQPASAHALAGLDERPAVPLPEVAARVAGGPHSLTDAHELGPWLQEGP